MTKPRDVADTANIGGILGDKLADSSISGTKLEDNSITGAKLAADISSSKINYAPSSPLLGRALNEKLTESVSVKDFGAVGDGTTDDLPAFIAARDYCNSNDIHLLVIPPGRYHLEGIWSVPSGGSYIPCTTLAYGAIVDNTVVLSGGTGLHGLRVEGSPDCGFVITRAQGAYHTHIVAASCAAHGFYFGIASRQILTVTDANGFQVGETVTGVSSGAFGTVHSVDLDTNQIELVKCNLNQDAILFQGLELISGSTSGQTADVTARSLPYGANYQVTRGTIDQPLAVSCGGCGYFWDGSATANRSWMNAMCFTSPAAVGNAGMGWNVRASYAGPNGSSQHNYNTFLNINCEGNTGKSLEDSTGRQNSYVGGHFVDTDGSGESVRIADNFNFVLGGRYLGNISINAIFATFNRSVGATYGVANGFNSVSTDRLNIAQSNPPGSSSATGTTGDIAWNSSYLYVCVGTNNWRRIPLESF